VLSDTVMKLSRLLFMVMPFLSGCVSNIPVDLTLVSISAVDWRDRDEIAGPGASPLIGLVGTRDLIRIGETPKGEKNNPRLLLKVEFTSEINLSAFVIKKTYNLGNSAYFCDRSKDPDLEMLSFPDVYWRGILLNPHDPDPIARQRKVVDGKITYYIFIDVVRDEVTKSKPPLEAYDLRQRPEDICFCLRGGNNHGFGYRSNVVTIPKDMISAVLRKLPKKIGG